MDMSLESATSASLVDSYSVEQTSCEGKQYCLRSGVALEAFRIPVRTLIKFVHVSNGQSDLGVGRIPIVTSNSAH